MLCGNNQIVFMGSNLAMEQAKKTDLYDSHISCNTYDQEELLKNKEVFDYMDCLISFENPSGAIFAINAGVKTFYIAPFVKIVVA